jgi:hypothetical protein
MPRYALRSDQHRTKAASLILPQMALRLFGIKFSPPERTYSSLQTGKFPFAYCGLGAPINYFNIKYIIGAPFLLHETLGCPIANLHSARSDLALRLFGIKFLPPERTYSSLQTGKFPFAYCGLKIIPDFQREYIAAI